MVFALECAHEVISVIGGNTSVVYAQIRQFFLQRFGCFQVSFASSKRYDFAAVPVAGIDEPNLPALLPHIHPKLIYFQAIIIRLFWPDHMPRVYQHRQHFSDADILNLSDIPDTCAANRHQ
jgi:hypothetical protein